ncbi:MAG: hypothetical protein HEQ16_03525 [Bosea sp.]|jgi:hypothetical protein|nr:hypothetical protein [Bosea sp. (in: a-proteobacteria)]
MSSKAGDTELPSPNLHEPDRFVEAAALSTDYLNHFAEALMLMEMAADHPLLVHELANWTPTTYLAHFDDSGLRCADVALAAYHELDAASRRAFEALCSAMDRLVATVVLTLDEIKDPAEALPIVMIAAAAFRNLLARATGFINSGGDMACAAYDKVELQDVIDRIMSVRASACA